MGLTKRILFLKYEIERYWHDSCSECSHEGFYHEDNRCHGCEDCDQEHLIFEDGTSARYHDECYLLACGKCGAFWPTDTHQEDIALYFKIYPNEHDEIELSELMRTVRNDMKCPGCNESAVGIHCKCECENPDNFYLDEDAPNELKRLERLDSLLIEEVDYTSRLRKIASWTKDDILKKKDPTK